MFFFCSFWVHFLDYFLITCLTTFGSILEPILGPDRTKKGQDEPKRAIKRFTEPKLSNSKNLKKPLVFQCFWGPEPPKRASRGPRRLPRSTQRAPKLQQKGFQKQTQKLPNFEPLLVPFWAPFWNAKVVQKGTKNRTTFGTVSLRLSRVRMTPNQELNESGEKGTVIGIIFSKRKGGI